MGSDLENKLPHLRQLFNIIYGVAAGALFLRMPSSFSTDPVAVVSVLLILTYGLFVIGHTWWRQAGRMSTTALTQTATLVLLIARIIAIFLFVLAAGWAANALTAPAAWMAFFALAAATMLLSDFEQYLVLRPLYGKHRVMQRREVITDTAFVLLAAAFLAGIAVQPALFMGWMGLLGLLLLHIPVRPIACRLTVWEEPPPPHRGGRRPERGGNVQRRRESQQRAQQRAESSATKAASVNQRPAQERRESRSRRGSRSGRSSSGGGGRRAAPVQKPAAKPEAEEAPSEPAPAAVIEPEAPVKVAPEVSEPIEPAVSETLVEVGEKPVDATAEPGLAPQPPADTVPEEEVRRKYGRRTTPRGGALKDETLSLPEPLESEAEALLKTPVVPPPEAIDTETAYGRRPKKRVPSLLPEEVEKETGKENTPADSPAEDANLQESGAINDADSAAENTQ